MQILAPRKISLGLTVGCLAGLLFCATSTWGADAAAQPFLHGLFTDHMVLQRDAPIPVWGWTQPGQQVTVRLNGQEATAAAGSDGKWMVHLGPFAAGGPYTLDISGPESIALHDVLVGDVWICSGQSNMEMGIGGVRNAAEEIAGANDANLRLYTVPKKIAYQPRENVESQWLHCTPQTVSSGGWGGFSAVAYFFGRDLREALHVPIGLIHTSWGGTVAEAWTSAEALRQMPDFTEAVKEVQAADKTSRDISDLVEEWYQKNDPGSASARWANPSLEDKDWKKMSLPSHWEDGGLPEFDGIVWFRKAVELPGSWSGQDLVLHLGPIDDRDGTFFNGTRVGGLDRYDQSRNYKVPGALVHSGRNVIAVRVLDTSGPGGIYGEPADLKIERAGDEAAEPIALAGSWKYHPSTPLASVKSVPPSTDKNNPNVVTVLYNGMIAPLVPFPIKGAIWYQGESNAGRGKQYRTLLPLMIRDWRSRFGVGDFPFLIVQLANFMAQKPQPSESAWAEVREAQLLTAQRLPDTGLAVAIDIGEANDIHPKNKQEVGRRLALAARAIAYGEDVEYSGPVLHGQDQEGDKIVLDFQHTDGGLVAKGGGPLKGFAVAGSDGHFVWAHARIAGDTVEVSSPEVQKPVAVRYDWADNPDGNLYNQAGLPASPFRTDTDE